MSLCSVRGSSLIINLLFLLWLLTSVFFLTSSLFVLFITYEFSLLPLVFIILFFGYQPEKLQATLYLIVYTVVGGLPLFFFVSRSFDCSVLHLLSTPYLSVFYVSLGFLIKSPLYLFHSWLPKAHTEAPVLGSIVLAGVILKLGGYGLLLLAPCFGLQISIYIYVCLTGRVVCSVICYRQWDMKSLVAYSSIIHIGVVTLGAMLATELS